MAREYSHPPHGYAGGVTSITIRAALARAWAFPLSALLFLASSPAGAASYTVQTGDTLYSIAAARGSDAVTLLNLNRLKTPTLDVGQVLQLPKARPAANPAPKAAARSATTSGAGSPAAQALKAVRSTTALPPGLPKLSAGPVRGPVAWNVKPSPTVASFIGFVPSIVTTAFGNQLPIRTFLEGLSFEHQTYNNCGPSALASVLGFYKAHISQDAIRRTTRQGNAYMQVSAIAPELAKFGLTTITIRGGRLDQVKRLLALGIPVIALQWYDRPGHIDHFRVVRGYDDQAGLVWVSDSMIGPVAYLSYKNFDALWNTQGRQMFPVYPKGFGSAVKALL